MEIGAAIKPLLAVFSLRINFQEKSGRRFSFFVLNLSSKVETGIEGLVCNIECGLALRLGRAMIQYLQAPLFPGSFFPSGQSHIQTLWNANKSVFRFSKLRSTMRRLPRTFSLMTASDFKIDSVKRCKTTPISRPFPFRIRLLSSAKVTSSAWCRLLSTLR